MMVSTFVGQSRGRSGDGAEDGVVSAALCCSIDSRRHCSDSSQSYHGAGLVPVLLLLCCVAMLLLFVVLFRSWHVGGKSRRRRSEVVGFVI